MYIPAHYAALFVIILLGESATLFVYTLIGLLKQNPLPYMVSQMPLRAPSRSCPACPGPELGQFPNIYRAGEAPAPSTVFVTVTTATPTTVVTTKSTTVKKTTTASASPSKPKRSSLNQSSSAPSSSPSNTSTSSKKTSQKGKMNVVTSTKILKSTKVTHASTVLRTKIKLQTVTAG